MIKTNPHKSIIIWLLTGCFLVYIMVVVGCLTRLTHSGLSITDWKFMGSLPPLTDQAWNERFAKYQESPEFKLVNSTMTLQEFKPLFWWEYIHRSIGNIIGFIFLGGFIYFLARKKFTKEILPKMILLFCLGALQGVIGWWMVKSGLNKQPAVSHYRLATHLMSAFSVFAFTFWFALQLIYPKSEVRKNEGFKLRNTIIIYVSLLILQIVYGAFTAGYVEGNNAKIRPGNVFNTWPKMGDEWMPEQVTMKETIFANAFENPSGIQFVHRTLAIIVVAFVTFIYWKSRKLNLIPQQKLGANLILIGVFIQFTLGVLTLIYHVPIVLGALHQTGAFFLFAASIYLLFQTRKV